MSLVSIDNTSYDVGVVRITRKASQRVESLGTTLDLHKHYDVKGTYYDYDVEFFPRKMSRIAYDALYEALTDPLESHTVTLPYGQTDLTFTARVTTTEDVLQARYGNKTFWGGIKVTFEALTPQKEA